MRTIELIIDGMRCRRCVRQATALLRDVPGLATVIADSKTSRITVTGDLDPQAVLDALAGTTFTVHLQSTSETPTSSTPAPDRTDPT